MKTILIYILAFVARVLLSFRYKIKVVGYDKLKKKGGTIFLPNHPAALVDPAVAALSIFPRFPIRPLIVEYMYFTPFIHGVMKFLDALPVPNFETSTNSLKRKRHDRVLSEVVKGLKNGENFLLYPAGRLKHTHIEKIGGASATHKIISECPEATVVLVRIKGLWGSSFSRALTGSVPPIDKTLKKGFWIILKNLLLFTPRREVEVELVPAPENFPYGATRLEMNQWLEDWYNQPDGLSDQKEGDTLKLVSYSRWREELPKVHEEKDHEDAWVPIKDIPRDVQEKILEKFEELTEIKPKDIKPEMSLAQDMGMDSLDISEMAMFLQDKFETNPIPVTELTTVDRVLAIAAKEIEIEEKEEEQNADMTKWFEPREHVRAEIPEGKTIPEVFFNICHEMGDKAAYADQRSGVLPYSRLKLAVVLFAEYIKKLPGQHIGIMLPATPGAFIAVLACQLAGKIPLMVNWTIGPRHIDAVQKLSGVEVVLTSWAFLERLDAVDLGSLDEKLVMLETVRLEFSIFEKIKGLLRSKMSGRSIMKHFGADKLTEHDPAVLLFTSGTENLPKGVPLSHSNILSDQRNSLSVCEIYKDDVVFSFLPPFHSFGFCITGLLGLLSGLRTAFYPNPTDGKGLAKSIDLWKASIICSAPTFFKSILKSAKPGQLDSMKICFIGAEKTPPEIFQVLDELGKKECLIEGYGITECSPILTVNRFNEPLIGVGKPIPGVELILVHHETMEPVAVGEEGLILARGPNVFSGYLNPGIASPFVSVNGKEWYNSGDIGFLDDQGNLTISGRMKRFIKIGGEMISLMTIEHALLEAAREKGWPLREDGPTLGIIAEEYPGGKPKICLVSVFDITTEEANDAIHQKGLSMMVRITDVKHMDELPLMGTGKTNYRLLEEKFFREESSTQGVG